ncbi:MAG TPA: lecithin retinol acyltransferase family protein [Burkholderiaceae bacterium]|nr:lecithin retinol acyltransferase family protein [Burkholderiaceae bacterium]
MHPAPDFPLGAHLVTRRFGYTHHGIYVGGGRVVHYAGLSRATSRGPVEEVSLADFACGRGISMQAEPDARYCADTIAARARSRLGEDRCGVIRNNCEHFCSWYLRGESRSEQIERVLAMPRAVTNALAQARRLLRGRPGASRPASASAADASA